MKIIHYILFFILFASCSNEFSLIEEKKDIPIVYGLLDQTDTAQYIRLERAFVDESINALELALDPNNLYYPNAEISLVNNTTGESVVLDKVDGDAEGLPRRTGIFATTPNVLYKVLTENFMMEKNDEIILNIKRDETLPLVTATTMTIGEGKITRPTPTASVDFNFISPTRFLWSKGDNAVLFDLSLVLNYQERDLNSGTGFERKSITWEVINNTEADEIEIEGRRFYETLNGAIDVNPNVVRRFLNVDFILASGGEELKSYIQVGQANLGITSSQDIPTYTNLSEGRGVFSSRTKFFREGVNISPNTIDSLVNGTITANLNFEL